MYVKDFYEGTLYDVNSTFERCCENPHLRYSYVDNSFLYNIKGLPFFGRGVNEYHQKTLQIFDKLLSIKFDNVVFLTNFKEAIQKRKQNYISAYQTFSAGNINKIN